MDTFSIIIAVVTLIVSILQIILFFKLNELKEMGIITVGKFEMMKRRITEQSSQQNK